MGAVRGRQWRRHFEAGRWPCHMRGSNIGRLQDSLSLPLTAFHYIPSHSFGWWVALRGGGKCLCGGNSHSLMTVYFSPKACEEGKLSLLSLYIQTLLFVCSFSACIPKPSKALTLSVDLLFVVSGEWDWGDGIDSSCAAACSQLWLSLFPPGLLSLLQAGLGRALQYYLRKENEERRKEEESQPKKKTQKRACACWVHCMALCLCVLVGFSLGLSPLSHTLHGVSSHHQVRPLHTLFPHLHTPFLPCVLHINWRPLEGGEREGRNSLSCKHLKAHAEESDMTTHHAMPWLSGSVVGGDFPFRLSSFLPSA